MKLMPEVVWAKFNSLVEGAKSVEPAAYAGSSLFIAAGVAVADALGDGTPLHIPENGFIRSVAFLYGEYVVPTLTLPQLSPANPRKVSP